MIHSFGSPGSNPVPYITWPVPLTLKCLLQLVFMRSDLSYSRYASNPGCHQSRFQSWRINLKIGLGPTGLSPIFRKKKSVLVHERDIGNPRNPTAEFGRYPIQVSDTKQAPIAWSIHQPEFLFLIPIVSLTRSMADPYPIHTSVAILRGKRLWLQSSSLSLCYGSKAFEVNRVWSTLSKQVWMLWIESFLIEEWPIHTFNPIFKVSIDGMDRKRFN